MRKEINTAGLFTAGEHGHASGPVAADETMARSMTVGALTHRAIASIAAVTLEPSHELITTEANAGLTEFRPIEKRAHRQNIAGAISAYFWHMLPPPHWLFMGSELHLGLGRIDLLWLHSDGWWLVDEVKVGHGTELGTRKTVEQVERYSAAGLDMWGDDFAGVRILTTGDPSLSIFAGPDQPWMALSSTPFVRKS